LSAITRYDDTRDEKSLSPLQGPSERVEVVCSQSVVTVVTVARITAKWVVGQRNKINIDPPIKKENK